LTLGEHGTKLPGMTKPSPSKVLAAALVAAFVGILPMAAAASTHSAIPACGGGKGKDGKDVKKPKPDTDDDKRPPNPA
jgi:hypothetical protein